MLVVIISATILLLLGQTIFNLTYQFPEKVNFGVTFSQKYASQLSGDWRDVYIKILDDLKVGHLRISSYWDEIEKSPSQFNFEDLDFMLSEAEKRGAKVILVLGERQPRWPECHTPTWASSLNKASRQQKVLEFTKEVVQRYKNNKIIWAFQVENEPLLPIFGDCNDPDPGFLKKEVALVRSLTDKTIIVSDSGELGYWILPMQLSDVFGTTLYRIVYNPITGYTHYPILPYFYNLKAYFVKKLFAPGNLKTVIIELQAEPWSHENNLEDTPLFTQVNQLSLDKFKEYVDYAKGTGFDEIYLWGVEWWYFMETQGYPQYLEFAKTLFR